MGTRIHYSTSTTRAFYRTLLPLLVALSLLASQLTPFGALPAAANAVGGGTDGLGFEIDGNFTVDTSGNSDWATRPYTTLADSTSPHRVFTGGTKEGDRAGWSVTGGNAPNKADILRLYADVEQVDADAWLRIGAERASGNGDTWVSVELNQANDGPTVPGTSVPLAPRDGDLLVTFQFPGNVGDAPVVRVDEWKNGGWSAVSVTAYGAANAGTITNPTGQTLTAREFLELSIDVSFLFGPDAPCRSFADSWARSRSSDSGPTSQLQDFVGPFPFGFDTCGDVSLRKTDTHGNGLAGAQLALYAGNAATGTPSFTCTTDSDGYCPDPNGDLDGLEPGPYTAKEVAPPAGFKLSSPSTITDTLAPRGNLSFVFENPPITYTIDVDPPDDTNAVGFPHEFVVTLTTDYLWNDGNPLTGTQPLANQTVDLAWNGQPDGSSITKVNGTAVDTQTTTCITNAQGECFVEVTSPSVGGPGTLTASFDTPLSGPAATSPAHTTAGGYFSSISDSGQKSWIGYRAALEGDFHNPLGEDHTFTASVYRVNASGSETVAADVEVSFDWSGPAGSGFAGGNDTCTTGALGTCQVTITSPDAAGKGTLSISQVEGDIVVGETLTITYDEGEEPSATKTWWDYRASIDGDSTNPIGEEHDFTVTVERTDGSLDGEGAVVWSPVPDGTTLDTTWTPTAPNVSSVTTDGCETGGTTGGTCVVTVETTNVGLGTLTIDGIAGTTLDGYLDGAAFAYEFEDGPAASKLWVDWEAHISFPAENPVGEEHTFTVSVEVYDGEGYVGVPDGTIVGLTLDAVDLAKITIVEDTCAAPGTVDGGCTLTVVAAEAIVLDVSVTSVDETVIDDGGSDRTVSFEFEAPVTSSKEWIEYRVLADVDAYNLTGEEHGFTLTAQERREGGTWQALAGVTLDVRLDTDLAGVSFDASDCTVGGTDSAGQCTVTVNSSLPGSATVVVDAIDGIELADGVTAGSTTTWNDVDVDEAAQTKTWLRYDVSLSGDAVNNLGDDHDFDVTVTVDDGSGPAPAGGATVSGTFTYDDGGSLPLGCTTDAAGECTITVPAPVDGDDTPIPGKGELVLDEVSHSFDGTAFTIDLSGTDGLAADFDQPSATKDWIDYELVVTPATATNLLPVEPEHLFTVSLSSSDPTVAPYAGQTIGLELDSDVASIIEIVDADGSRTFDPEDGIVSESCTTTATGICEVLVRSTTPGTAELTASFAATLGEASFDLEASGAKLWTTFRVSVNPQNAQNLLGTPHLFTVTIEQTDDGVDFYPVAGAVPTLDITAPAFIVDSDCDEGTDAAGECTATVDSESTGVFTFTAEYEGVVGDQSAAFSATGDKGWIDYQVLVTPEVAENLIDTDHEFTVTVNADIGAGWEQVSGAIPTLTLEGPGMITSENCSEGTAEDGTCTVTIRSTEPGLSTLTATYEGAAGGGDFDNPIETADYVDSGAKLWVDYLLDVTPETAINALDDPHTYTVTLQRDEGDEPFAFGGATVAVSITGPGTITAVSAGQIAEDGRSATCTTGDAGTCDVTIVSGTPGTTTLSATYDAVVGETSGTFEATAEKHWAAIELVKTALVDEGEDGFKTVTYSTDPDVENPVITYEYTITNVGPVALTVTSLEDDVLGTITLPAALVLEPGASHTATAEHVVTRADADAGEIYNVAVVLAQAEDGTEVSDQDDEEVFVITVLAGGSISLVKTALVDRDEDGNRTFQVRQGENATVTYRYLITNNGNVPLSDLSLFDDKIGDIPVPDVTLEPGESITVDATYTVTAADIAAGEIENVAIVTGYTPDGVEVTAEDDEIVFPVEVLPVVVTQPAPTPVVAAKPLPRTGVDAGLLLTIGLLMAAMGAAALLFTPRRRREQ
jgi:hypothetical protein